MTQHARQLGLFEQATQMDHEGGAEDARMVKTPEQVTALCQRLEAAPVAAIPSVNETGDLDGVGICLRPGKAWIVPLIESNVALSEVVSALIQVPVVVAHDVKKLLHALDRENVICQATFFDVMVAAHLCNVPMSQLNLTELAAKFLVPSPAPKSDASGWGSTSTAAALITQAETL